MVQHQANQVWRIWRLAQMQLFFNNGSAPGKPGLEDMETRSNAAEDTAADGNAGAKGQLKSLLMRTKAAGHNSSQW